MSAGALSSVRLLTFAVVLTSHAARYPSPNMARIVSMVINIRSGRSLRDGYEYAGEVVLLLFPRAEAQKVVGALRSAGKARPIMPAGIERLDDNPGSGLAVPLTRH